MNCPNCNSGKIKVEETRDAGELVIRVRRCPACGWRVTTHEVFAENQTIPKSIRRPRKTA